MTSRNRPFRVPPPVLRHGLWQDLQKLATTFDHLKTDYINPEFPYFLQACRDLESLMIPCHEQYEIEISHLDLSGHFHSLRKLFLPECDVPFLNQVISSSPQLEELAIPLEQLGDKVSSPFKPSFVSV
jgi:hypothetical protein